MITQLAAPMPSSRAVPGRRAHCLGRGRAVVCQAKKKKKNSSGARGKATEPKPASQSSPDAQSPTATASSADGPTTAIKTPDRPATPSTAPAAAKAPERESTSTPAATAASSANGGSASPLPSQVPAVSLSRPRARSSITAISRDKGDEGAGLPAALVKKIVTLVALVTVARVGVFDRLPGVDIARFSESVASNGILGYVDNITGGSISNVGVFSLGIIPAINASIFLQVLTVVYPSLKKMQREDGAQGRARYQLYQKLAALLFASAQAFGQLNALKPFATDFSPEWFLSSGIALVAGAMITNQLADYITELKLGNGTSVLIFANIASYLPSSVGQAFQEADAAGSSGIAVYLAAFLATTFAIVCVQAAERRVPLNSASRYNANASLSKQNYFPFKVNGTGVMPVIFASSLLAVPPAIIKFGGFGALGGAANAVAPGGALYLPLSVVFIAVINQFYTFLQFDPNDIADNLKRGQMSIPGCRPGKSTAEFVTERLSNMAILGSIFLGALASAPALTEAITGVPALRGFAGTSVLIIVGVATDTARRIKAEKQMSKYGDIDDLYEKL